MRYNSGFKLIIGIISCSILFLLFSSYPVAYSINASEDKLVFTVVSDVHIKDSATQEDDKFKNCLSYLNEKYPNMDAFIAAGDITDGGTEKEYNKFNEIYNKYSNKNWQRLISMGNHDFWNELSAPDAMKRFESKIGNSPNSHTTIKGYYFITIASENGDCNGTFTDISRAWLKTELDKAVADSPDTPIFIIVHQPVKDTVYGSDDWGNPGLDETLKNYPQAVVFAGHSHYPLNDERSINQKNYTSVNTGSLSYISLETDKINGNMPPNATAFAQGVVVEVTSKSIKFIPTDFYNKQPLNSTWTVKLPINKSEFQYTDKRGNYVPRPYFNSDDSAVAKEISYDAATIDFNTGVHPNFVHSYQIQIWNMDTNKIDQQVYAFSDFYLNKHSERQTVRLTNLAPHTKYKVYIKAVESYGHVSTNSLNAEFTTSSK